MIPPFEYVAGYPVKTLGVRECSAEVVSCIREGKMAGGSGISRWLACLNPHSYVAASSDPGFSKALREADWLIPDGIGIVLASRIFKGRIRKRITGSDVFLEVLEKLNIEGGYSVFFLGSTRETLEAILRRMAVDFPNVKVAGTLSPPFKTVFSRDDLKAMVSAINTAEPDVLWVGMTAPKQEKWILQNKDKLKVKFIGAIGAAFDFYAGTVRRSHPIFQKSGLEWLPRLLKDPFRLWRRTFISAPKFFFLILNHRIKNRKSAEG